MEPCKPAASLKSTYRGENMPQPTGLAVEAFEAMLFQWPGRRLRHSAER